MTTDDISIDYNPKNGRFILSSPPWFVDRMRVIPNRRWDGKKKVWTAPAIRANVEHLRQAFDPGCFTAAAAEMMARASEPKRPNTDRFPVWYKFRDDCIMPWQHQRTALNKLYDNSAFALFMDMRTGKSRVIIDACAAYRMENKVDSVVVVCPYSVRQVWPMQWFMYSPISASCHVLDTRKRREFDEWSGTKHDLRVLVVGVESLAAGGAKILVEQFMLSSTKVLMVVDESHKIKTHNAVRSRNCMALGMMANYRIIMSGTSVAKGVMDLFMQFEYLDPTIIGVGDFYSFRNRYAVMGGYEDRQIIGYQNMDELMELIAPFSYEVSRKDVFDLPPKQMFVRKVAATDKQRAMYNSVAKNKVLAGDAGTMTVQTVLEKMLRLHEIAGGSYSTKNPDLTSKTKYLHHAVEGQNPKVQELLDIAQEYDGQMIVWCTYRLEIDAVVGALRKVYGNEQVVEVHGDIDGDTRHRNVYDQFQTGKARFLVGTASTGGMSYNMSAAEIVVYFSNTFNYVDRKQSEDRTQSAEQTKSVAYIDLVLENSVDELVMEALEAKQDVSDYVRKSIRRAQDKLILVP